MGSGSSLIKRTIFSLRLVPAGSKHSRIQKRDDVRMVQLSDQGRLGTESAAMLPAERGIVGGVVE